MTRTRDSSLSVYVGFLSSIFMDLQRFSFKHVLGVPYKRLISSLLTLSYRFS